MKALKTVFTLIVVVMVFLPLPPTTLIGLAIIANPFTNRFLDDRVLEVMRNVKSVFKRA